MFCCQVSSFHLYPNLGQMRWQLCHAQVSRTLGEDKTWFILPHGTLRKEWKSSTFPGDSAGMDIGKGNGKRKFLLSPLCLIFEIFYALWKQTEGYMALHIHTLLPLSAHPLVLLSSSLISVSIVCFKPKSSGWVLLAGLQPFVRCCFHWECCENIAHPFSGCFGGSRAGSSSWWEKRLHWEGGSFVLAVRGVPFWQVTPVFCSFYKNSSSGNQRYWQQLWIPGIVIQNRR